MDLYEYQAKQLFAHYGVPTQVGEVVTTPEEARAAAMRFNCPVVVKAQVKIGGRGKAGGVKFAADPATAFAVATDILGLDIRGHTVHRVLVTPAEQIAEEYYVSFLVDRAERGLLCMASVSGGIDIEQVAAETPERLVRMPVDAISGLTPARAAEICAAADFPVAVRQSVADVLLALWQVFTAGDALLVEVNPLVRTPDDRIVALDGKVTLDANAFFRHPDYAKFADPSATDPLEQAAAERDLNYVKLDGEVGIIGNGAGLVMSTLDVVAYAGEQFGGVRPANFLDIGGGASAQVMADGLEIVLSDPDVTCVLVNVFGGITACDAVADGIVGALAMLADRGTPVTRPIVVRLDGNNAVAGRRILAEADLPTVELIETMDAAAARAAELAFRARPAAATS